MSRPVTIFADNGVRTLHRYVAGRPPRREIDAWAGMCMEAHRDALAGFKPIKLISLF